MVERDLPEGTVTLLLTDIEGSTPALHRLGGRYGESLEAHRRIVRAAATSHGGVEVDTQGDSFLFAFPRADDALDAASELVAELEVADWQEGVALLARVGVHTGHLERVGDSYVGLELHRAARIGACAHGGQVVVSASTRALGGARAFVDLGHHLLKGFDDTERLFQLLDDAGTVFPPLRAQAARALPRVSGTFVNRLVELEEVRRLLARAAPVSSRWWARVASGSRDWRWRPRTPRTTCSRTASTSRVSPRSRIRPTCLPRSRPRSASRPERAPRQRSSTIFAIVRS